MMNAGFDPISQARFHAFVENELKHLWKQIDLLWTHNKKRSAEIEAIRGRINGAVYSLAMAALGMIYAYLIKPKLGL